MKCLFVFQDCPLSFNYSGSASRRMMDYEALNSLGVKIYVLRLLSKNTKLEVLEFEKKNHQESQYVRNIASEWQDLDYDLPKSKTGLLPSIIKLLVNPVDFFYPGMRDLTGHFKLLVEKIDPDIVWTGFQPSSILVLKAAVNLPWIHYIGDWRHKLRLLRNGNKVSLVKRLKARLYAYGEFRIDKIILNTCTVIQTASSVQGTQIKNISNRPVFVISQFYSLPEVKVITEPSHEPPKIIHLGSLRTTSNRIGLRDYLKNIHDGLNAITAYKLTVVGDTTGTNQELKNLLKKENVECCGRVDDLGEIVSAYDIGIIPYNYNTGMRTKIALFHKYKMPVLTFRKSVEGMEEIENDNNAILVDNFKEFEEKLILLINSLPMRMEIGNNGFKTFKNHNSLESQINKYKKIIKIATE